MDKFWELFEESVILQGIITCAFVFVACYLMATGREIPENLDDMLMVVLGFWFGTKSQLAMASAMKRMSNGSSSSDLSVTISDTDS